MAATQAFDMHAAALAQIWNFPKLKGHENYQPWSKRMKCALKYCGLWDIVENGAERLPADLPRGKIIDKQISEGGVCIRSDERPTSEQVLAYGAAVKTWQDLNHQAAEAIYSMCEDKLAEAIEHEDTAMNCWIKLQTDYTDSGSVPRFTKLQELWATTLSSSNNSIETYIANIRSKANDLKRMGAAVDEWILVALLLNNLDSKYRGFVHRLVIQLDERPDFHKVVALLREEDRLLKHDDKQQAMDAAMRKLQKKQEEKKPSRYKNESGCGGRNSGRSRGNNNNNHSNDRASKNPNSTNYKANGEAPECSKCTPNTRGYKKRHWPLDCWTLHPEKKPNRYQNKPKANVATTDRPDDFLDNINYTHFAPMAHLIANEEDTMSFEEFWGLGSHQSNA